MRTIEELLKVLTRNYQRRINDLKDLSGVCYEALDIYSFQNLIQFDEYEKLKTFIRSNRPKFYNKYYDKRQKHNAFYWPRGEFEQRQLWLDHMLNKKWKLKLFDYRYNRGHYEID